MSRRAARGHALAPKQLERGIVLAYVGEDEVFREAIIEFDPGPGRVDLEAGPRAWQLGGRRSTRECR